MLKNNVPAPSCIPPAGLEVLTRRHVNDALSELDPRSGLKMLKGHQNSAQESRKSTPIARDKRWSFANIE
jgi:hypothetical protein